MESGEGNNSSAIMDNFTEDYSDWPTLEYWPEFKALAETKLGEGNSIRRENLQELRDSNNNGLEEEQLEIGLTLVLDYNEERQNYNFNAKDGKNSLNHHGDSVSIYLDTISTYRLNLNRVLLLPFRF